jgi:intracellular sulfur oxidation DsrE/DsrF family protein
MKKILVILCLLWGSATVMAQSSKRMPEHRVIMQLTQNNPEAHKGLIHQLKALTSAWGDSVAIEVLAHGPGVEMFMTEKATQQEAIQKLKSNGVHFVICENTLTQKSISKEQLLPDLEYVRFGLVEVITKQEQGWTYLKAGF